MRLKLSLPKIALPHLSSRGWRRVGLVSLFLALALAPLLLTAEHPVRSVTEAVRTASDRIFGPAHEAGTAWLPDPAAGGAPGASDGGYSSPSRAAPAPASVSPGGRVATRMPLPVSGRGPRPLSATDAARAGWSWERAKVLAATAWEAQLPGSGSYSDFYCGCATSRHGASGGSVDLASCGYQPRKNPDRAARLEWEHILPAARIGAGRACWISGAPQCVKDGEPFKGRACCEIADPGYNLAATDPVNLAPAVGEVNGDRVDMPYGEIPAGDTAWTYGQCGMRIDPDRDIAEPVPSRRGDVARVMAYMSQAYRIPFTRAESDLYGRWMREDPVSDEEIRVNRAIEAEGYRPNQLVLGR